MHGMFNIGVRGVALNALCVANTTNIGVLGRATYCALGASANYAIEGDLGANNGGITTAGSNSYAGYFVGDVASTTGFFGFPSDSTLKDSIENLNFNQNNPISIINSIPVKTYTYKQDQNESMILPVSGKHYGMLAQDVENVLPNCVKNS